LTRRRRGTLPPPKLLPRYLRFRCPMPLRNQLLRTCHDFARKQTQRHWHFGHLGLLHFDYIASGISKLNNAARSLLRMDCILKA
jgi:hypothetical protein